MDITYTLTLSDEDKDALDAALVEYGFSTEPGGANHCDGEAEERYAALSKLMARVRVGEALVVSQLELEAIREAGWELGFSAEPGGANEGETATEAQAAVVADIVFRAERASL